MKKDRISALLLLLLFSVSCSREDRSAKTNPFPSTLTHPTKLSELQPGSPASSAPVENPYEKNAVALSEGKRLFSWFNCVGCHSNGGGGMGPPLMDDLWIYGSEPDQIFATITEGRPNGMPSFGGKIPDYQVWQIAAFVRSMSGQAPSDAAPSRDDHMNVKTPESRTERLIPRNSVTEPPPQ